MSRSLPAAMTTLLQSLKSKEVYFHTTLIYLGERIFGITISFVVYTALTRVYGPTLIGAYSYVQTVMLFALPFLAAGSEGIIIREFVRAGSSRNELMGSAFVVLTVTGLVATIVPLFGIWLFQGNDKALVYMALFTAIGFLPSGFLVVEQAFKTEQKARPIALARGCSVLLSAIARLYVIYHRYPIELVVLISAAEAFLLTALLLWFYSLSHSIAAWKYSAARARYIFRQSFPGMMAAIAVMLLFRVNHVLLVYLAGFETVGQYAVAFQTCQLFLVLPQVFFGAIYPRLVHLHSHDPDRYRTVLNICYYGFTLLGYLVLLFCIVFAQPLFNVVFGPKYHEASQIIILLAVANVFNYSGAVRAHSIDIANSSHYHFWDALLGLVILIPTSWIAIPAYGAYGAAICIGVAMFVEGVLTTLFLPAVRGDAAAQLKSLLLVPSFKFSNL